MGLGVEFFEKNKIDLDNSDASITITDGTATDTGGDFVDQVRNRNNYSGWATTGSNDAANTQIDIDTTDQVTVDTLFLLQNNFSLD